MAGAADYVSRLKFKPADEPESASDKWVRLVTAHGQEAASQAVCLLLDEELDQMDLIPEFNGYSNQWEVSSCDVDGNHTETYGFDSEAEADEFIQRMARFWESRGVSL